MNSRSAIGNQVLSRPSRTEIQEVCQWLDDSNVQFQYMISIIRSRRTAACYRAVVREFMDALQEFYPAAGLSYLYCLETFPILNLHLLVNGTRLLSKSFIEDFFNRRSIDAVVSDYTSAGGIRYAFKQSGYNTGFEYDFSSNIFTVREGNGQK